MVAKEIKYCEFSWFKGSEPKTEVVGVSICPCSCDLLIYGYDHAEASKRKGVWVCEVNPGSVINLPG